MSSATLYFGVLWSLPDIIDLNKYKVDFAQEVEKQSGFKFSCEDIQLKRSLSPYLNVKMHHTLLLYPNDEVFLKLKDSELKVKLLPLILNKVVIKDAKLTRPIINVTLYKDFSTSLEKYFDATKSINTKGFSIDAVVKDTICERYKLKINDETTGKLFYLEGDELLLKDVKLNDKIHFILKGSLFENEKEYLRYDLDLTTPLTLQKAKFTFSPFLAIYESDIKGEIAGKLVFDKKSNITGFLNVDNVSLKADDLILADNNVNLLFKGQEAQIKSILHTSKTDVCEVDGKISYGKKKNIDMTTKARNIDLKNLHKVVSLISQMLNIPNEIKDFDVSGFVDADFALNSDFKKLKSQGNAKIINAKIIHKSLPYAVSDIMANINLDNNNILIENAHASVNSTPIDIKGKINEDVSVDLSIVSENLNLKKLTDLFKITLPVDIKNGKLTLNSQIKGYLNNNLKADSKILLTDLSFVEKVSNIPFSVNETQINLVSDTKKYQGSAVLSGFSTNYNKTPILAKTLNVSFDDKKISIPQNEIIFSKSPLIFSCIVNEYAKKTDFSLSFDGDMLATDVAMIFKDIVNQPYKAQGVIKTSGKVSSNDSSIDFKIKLNADEKNYLSYVVIKELLNKPSSLTIDGNLKEKSIHLKNLSLKENFSENSAEILSLAGNLKLDKEIIFDNLKLNIPKSLSVSTNFLGGEDISLDASIVLNNTISNPIIKGSAQVHTYNIKKYLTAIKNAELVFDNDKVKVIAPDIQINNSKLNLIADVNINNRTRLEVSNAQVFCPNLDLNSLFEITENIVSPFSESFLIVKNGVATINNFALLDIKARDISTDFDFSENTLRLKDISANAYNGEIKGNVDYDMSHHNLNLILEGSNIDMKSSLYDICKIDDNISGIADFKTTLSMITGDEKTVLSSLNGKLDFKSTNGKMGTLGKFEYYLYAQNILYHGFLKTTLNRIADMFKKGDTAQYRTAEGSLLFKDGYMITDNVKTIGKDMSLYVKGRHNLISNQVNIDIYGRISDEITSKLGSFGDVSIADLLDSQTSKTNSNSMFVPEKDIENIPLLYNQGESQTKTFKVNLLGDIDSLGAINSFMWIFPQKQATKEELPEFLDIIQNL